MLWMFGSKVLGETFTTCMPIPPFFFAKPLRMMVEPENFGELATVEFPDTTPEAAESDNPVPHKATEAPAEETPSTVQETPHPVKTVAGIPVKHVIFFGAGILICVTVLVGLKLAAVNREDDEDEDFDDYDE